jgi:hypothetical protein
MKRFTFPFLSMLALASFALAIVFSAQGSGVTSDPTPVPHFSDADVRIEFTDGPVVSRNQDPVYVELESGVIPEDVSVLTVLTDEDCMPDADGVSHCLNRVEYATASGAQYAALRHHHKMSEEPCLAPGQTLEIVR